MLGVTRFEDLDIYKLAVQVRRDIVRLSSRGPGSRDRRFVDQIRNAARGGPRNISEGFSRSAPAEFSKFLSYAKASLDETKTHVYDGHESGYFTNEERDRLVSLLRRTIGGTNRLIAYLESPDAARMFEELRKRQRQQRFVKRARAPSKDEPNEPQNPEPQNPEPQNPEPRNREPGTGNPRTREPQNL
jgi:four helix bundle protein